VILEILKHIVTDPLNTDALSEALKRVEQLQAENDELRSRLPLPNPMEPHPEGLKYASEPFRVRRSMRDRKAKAEAKFNRVYRNIKLLNDDLVGGDINVSEQIGQNVRQPSLRQSDGRSGIGLEVGKVTFDGFKAGEEKEGPLHDE